MRAPGFVRAMRRIVCRAPWSALAVTEHVFTTTTSAVSTGAGSAPDASNCSSNPSESAWLTRQPNVITEYFKLLVLIADLARGLPTTIVSIDHQRVNCQSAISNWHF